MGDFFGTGLETALNGNGLQTFLRNSGPALRHIMAPADMTALQGVADNLASAGLSRRRGGVCAAPDAGQATSLLQRAAHEMFGVVMGGGPGTAIGSAIAGPLGATVGAGMAAVVGKAL